MDERRRALVAGLRANAKQWHEDGSHFYGTLVERLAEDVEQGGPCWPVLRAHADHSLDEVPGVRLLGGVHRLVLQGRAPALARHYESVGGDGDAEAAWPLLRDVVARHASELAAWVDHVPQTNEVSRSMALVGGWLVVAAETGKPLRLLEPGASAGLNLRCDRYWYESGGDGYGDRDSPVRFVDRWSPRVPPLATRCEIAQRRGCDRFPLDSGREDDRLTLLAYVWPDQRERFELLRAALDVARAFPVEIDKADGPEWLEAQLATLPAGHATLVFHSYFWQYLNPADATRARRTIEDAGDRAEEHAPLAWLALEEAGGDYAHSELRLTTWPGGEERLLATCHVHPHEVDWVR
jgi:hypothetical protein